MIVDLFGNGRVPNPNPSNPVGGFNSYAAGSKTYGAGRSMPNIGPVSGSGTLGYAQRDNEAKARRDAVLRRLKGQQLGNPMNQAVQNYQNGI
jgi:hypothetical protein